MKLSTINLLLRILALIWTVIAVVLMFTLYPETTVWGKFALIAILFYVAWFLKKELRY